MVAWREQTALCDRHVTDGAHLLGYLCFVVLVAQIVEVLQVMLEALDHGRFLCLPALK